MTVVLLLLALTATTPLPPDVSAIVGPPGGAPLREEMLVRRTKEVASLLRCPVCQGLSVADSPAAMALNMKRQVRELLSRGYTEEQVLAYFERSYGSFVLLSPPRQGINWLVWLGPVLALLAGAIIVFSIVKKRARAPEPSRTDPELEPYLARARELAYGPRKSTTPDSSV